MGPAWGVIYGDLRHPDACKPCAWFWHRKGCQSGVDCEFCHLCPKGELKARQARQKELKSVPRRLDQMRAVAVSNLSNVADGFLNHSGGASKTWEELQRETVQSQDRQIGRKKLLPQ